MSSPDTHRVPQSCRELCTADSCRRQAVYFVRDLTQNVGLGGRIAGDYCCDEPTHWADVVQRMVDRALEAGR